MSFCGQHDRGVTGTETYSDETAGCIHQEFIFAVKLDDMSVMIVIVPLGWGRKRNVGVWRLDRAHLSPGVSPGLNASSLDQSLKSHCQS